MADFAEWVEGTTGVVADDGDGDDLFNLDDLDAQIWQHAETDAVVCLVDCSASMFEANTYGSGSNRGGGGGGQSMYAAAGAQSSSGGGAATFFSMAMESIHTFLMEKIVTSTEDVAAVVLYNTLHSFCPPPSSPAAARAGAACASADSIFVPPRGVFVAQEAARIGARCVQRVEQLQAAGDGASASYRDFVSRVGHAPLAAPNAAALCCSFSEVLSVARDILCVAGTAFTTQHRRVFVFTNASDPTYGSVDERLLCTAQARELAAAGVSMEVFGFGERADIREAPAPSASAALAGQCGGGFFDASVVWSPLLEAMKATPLSPSPASLPDSHHQGDSARTWATGEINAVHVHAGAAALHRLLSTVAHRAHPQRHVRHCQLRIGGVGRPREEGDAMASPTASASVLPRMAVSLYHPIARARPFKRELWDEKSQRPVRRVVHLHPLTGPGDRDAGSGSGTSTSAGSPPPPQQQQKQRTASPTAEDAKRQGKLRNEETQRDEDGGGVAPGKLQTYAQAGDARVPFTAEERRALLDVAAAGLEPGFTILVVKDRAAAVQSCHSLRHSFFLHPCLQQGGPQSHRLFVLLVRRLRAKDRVAIAQYRSSSRAPPRLVALVPSPDLSACPQRRSQYPAEGLGLYVVPLPYAEEVRPLPDLHRCASVDPANAPCLCDPAAVDPQHCRLAQQIVSALTVTFDVDAVVDPVLQRQREVLQERARRLYPLPPGFLPPSDSEDDGGGRGEQRGVDAGACAAAKAVEEDEEVQQQQAPDPLERDSTLPDYAGMRRYERLFDVFHRGVLGSEYDAEAYCPQPSTAPPALRRPRAMGGGDAGDTVEVGTEEGEALVMDLVTDAAARHAWEQLTVQVIKAYLAKHHVSLSTAKRKPELLELLKAHYRQHSS